MFPWTLADCLGAMSVQVNRLSVLRDAKAGIPTVANPLFVTITAQTHLDKVSGNNEA